MDELIAEARRLEGDYSDNYEVVTHMSVLADAVETAWAELDAALARITELRQSLRSESLARRVDGTLLREYERRFAEAAKLHRKRKHCNPDREDVFVCDECTRINRYGIAHWPCPTAAALGLNEGENEK